MVVILLLPERAVAAPVTHNFSNISAGSMQFVSTATGATFSFPQFPNDFSVTSVANFTSPVNLTGLLGEITGVYKYNTADIVDLGGGLLLAPVSPASDISSRFVIHDGAGHDLTANLLWNTIMTISPGGGLDLTHVFNLTNFQYSGSNGALQEIAQYQTGSLTTTFVTPFDLNGLATQCAGGCGSSFAGTMTASGRTFDVPGLDAVPEPSSFLFLLSGLLGIGALSRRIIRF